jgi:hypothetical protein
MDDLCMGTGSGKSTWRGSHGAPAQAGVGGPPHPPLVPSSSSSVALPPLTGRADCHSPPTGRLPDNVRMDWLTVSASGGEAVKLREVAFSRLAGLVGAPEEGLARGSTLEGWKFAGGAHVGWGSRFQPGSDQCVVTLPGGFLEPLAPTDCVDLMRALVLAGGHVTRLDVALDYLHVGADRVRIVEQMVEACERRELCGLRTWRVMREGCNGGDGGLSVYMGRRGKWGGGTMVRAYDKGLERGAGAAGVWQRIEAEFSGDRAHLVAIEVMHLPVSGRSQGMRELVLGAIDFREGTGDAHLDRRPRLRFWSELLAGVVGAVMKVQRQASSAAGWARWLRRAVMPSIAAMADALGRAPGDLFELLRAGVVPTPASLLSPATHQARGALMGLADCELVEFFRRREVTPFG